MNEKIFLHPQPLAAALACWEQVWGPQATSMLLPGEIVPIEKARGRITAELVSARLSSPHYQASAMDGFAVRAHDTFGASLTHPVKLSLGKEAIAVDTGEPLPEGKDAVIIQEEVNRCDPETIEIFAPAVPWQNVRLVGEDMVASEMVLPVNHEIRPIDIAALLMAGILEVKVRRNPRVALIPTGNELIEPGKLPQKGEILETNSRMLASLIEEIGGQPIRYPPVKDDLLQIQPALKKGIEEADLILILAGASAGRRDFTTEAIRNLGEVFVHGVNIRPGKPVVLAKVKEKPVMGMPGYPVSTFLAFTLFVKPLLCRMLGKPVPAVKKISAFLSRKIASPPGMEEFLRVKISRIGEKIVAAPLSRGAGLIHSLVQADGWIRIPANCEGLMAGEKVEAELLRPEEEIEKTLLLTGSHDLTLDVLASELSSRFPGWRLSLVSLGSMAGLIALQREEAHLAGCHLFDEESGEYNLPFLRRLLPGLPVVVVNLVYREQGLIVAPGNPKKIQHLTHLLRKDVIFINRQRGSGTRILLDYYLKKLGIDSAAINGYQQEVYTHTAVAVAVASNSADAGLGIRSAASIFQLDFIPLTRERFDLIIPRKHFFHPAIDKLIAILQDQEFRNRIMALGGYDVSCTGEIREFPP